MRKIGYLRVSTEEQRPDRQIDGRRTECDELHIETLSAVSKKRPIYEAVIEKLRPGDMLVVWDLDRAYRSARDALNEFSALDQRGVSFRAVNFPIDARTAEGYYCFTVMSANNELERRILSRRTKEGWRRHGRGARYWDALTSFRAIKLHMPAARLAPDVSP